MLHQITRRTEVPKELVRKVLHDTIEARSTEFEYGAHSGVRFRGRNPVIRPGAGDARVVYTAMQAGVGITEAT